MSLLLKYLAGVREKPLGVVLLGGLAFVSSFVLAIVGLRLVWVVLRGARNPDIAPLGYLVIPLGLLAFLALSYIAFVAGSDLWQLRPRGRMLTIVSMVLNFLFGSTFLLAFFSSKANPSRLSELAGMSICFFSCSSIVYLMLPAVRNQFADPPK